MRKKPFGPPGVEVPVIGQGTWNVPEARRRGWTGRSLRFGAGSSSA